MFEYFNLTNPQIGIWETEKFFGGTSIGNIGGTLLLKEEINIEIWQKAINKLIEVNDAIRLRINLKDGKPIQYLSNHKNKVFNIVDFAGKTKEEQDAWISEKMQTPFELLKSDLFEVFILKSWNGEQGYYFKLHHIIADAWTVSLIGTETLEYYRKLMKGESIENEVKPSYLDFIKTEQEYLSSSRFLKDKEYWKEKFEERPNLVSIKLKNIDNPNTKAKRMTFIIEGEDARAIRFFCKDNKISPAVLFEGVLSIYISRFLDIKNIIIGTPVLNRSGGIEKNTAGMFVSTIPIKVSMDDGDTFSDLCKKIGKEHMSVFRHQKYPYNLMLAEIRKKHKISYNLYDFTVSYQNAKILNTNHHYSFRTRWYFNGNLPESLNLHIEDRDDSGFFVLHYDYLVDMFTENEIEDLNKRIQLLMTQAIENPKFKISHMELVDKVERERLMDEFNNTYVDYSKDKCVHEIFEEQVKNIPNDIAVVFKDRKLTYSELNRRCNLLARILRNRGVKRKDITGIMLERSEDIFIAQFGILKSGGSYLPIDPTYPPERIRYILQDSNMKMIITSSQLEKDHLLDIEVEVICINELAFNNEKVVNLANINESNDGAYLIYTSGSTGKPKGIIVNHRGVVNFCKNNIEVYTGRNLEVLKCFVSTTTISFDAFVTESLLPLLNGLTVVIADENEQNIQSKLNKLIVKNNVEVIQTTPTRMKLLISDKDNLEYLTHLKSIMLGGEELTKTLYKQLKEITEARIFNIYGPTETTDWSTKTEIISEDITIGKPIGNTQIYILDKYMKPVPIGVCGEIYIGGDGVSNGYYNREGLTKEKFLYNHFKKEGKMFRTGDLGYWRNNGDIVHIGRNDFQVKIRGLRIELGEIERVLQKHPLIEDAIVNSVQGKNRNINLCAYYVSPKEIAKDELSEFLKESLPDYMIPVFFMHLEEVPLTPNGKVDRQALPKPSLERKQTLEYVAPSNKLEEKLEEILCSVFEAEKISVKAHFFNDLGGDSLSVILVQSLAEKQGIDIKAREIYEYPTIRLIAANLKKKKNETINNEEGYYDITTKLREFNSRKKLKKVLLTGATGFLGAHILWELLDSKVEEVVCLVRDESKLNETLKYYFCEELIVLKRKKIVLVKADIKDTNFGLSKDEYKQLTESIDTVIHAAANVRHFGFWDEFYKTNIEGTQEVINFCIKSKAKLHHISTLGVSGEGLVKQTKVNPEFTEDNLYIGQDYKSNVYIYSKYLAEKDVIDSIEEGLDACIYRVGNLMWREYDGKFQKNHKENGFISRINAIKKLGIIPEEFINSKIDITPVDRCAEAIIKLAKTSDRCQIYHLINHNELSYHRIFREINKKLEVVRIEEFLDSINENKQDESVGILSLYLNEIKYDMQKLNLQIKSEKTKKILEDLGFNWSIPSKRYLEKYL